MLLNSQDLDSTANSNTNTLSKKDSLLIKLGIKDTGIDSTIHSTATDSITLDLRSKKMRYRGDAKIKFQSQNIEAEILDILFEESTLEAYGTMQGDTLPVGFPILEDKGEKYAGEKLRFNFRTQKGVITAGETHLDEGFYFGDKIKRISKNEMYIKDGYYTTCDHPEPHYHFGAKKMKFISGDKIFIEPIYFYLEDMPVAVLPFGVFFPMQSGRQSGVIIPSFYFSQNRGVVFKNLGFYWAASDFWDTQFKSDLFTKGGYMFKNYTRWKKRDVFDGNFNVEYGRTRNTVEDDWTTNWRFAAKHSQKLSPQEQIDVNLNFASSNFNRSTYSGSYANSRNDWMKQNISSHASYSRTFDNRSSLSLSYDRDQNIIDDSYTQGSRVSYNIPSVKPLSSVKSLPDWLRDLQTRMSISGIYQNSESVKISSTKEDDNILYDTSMTPAYKNRLELRPNLSVAPKLGYFTFVPSINYSANVYSRSVEREYSEEKNEVIEKPTYAPFYEHQYSLSARLSTKLFGIIDNKRPLLFFIKPENLGFTAFRHTYQPSISMAWHPDQSDNINFFGNYINQYGDTVMYSKFQSDGGGLAYRQEAYTLSYSDRHIFEIKIPQGDSAKPKNIELLSLNFNGGYNFAADSLGMQDIRVTFRTPTLKFLEFSGSASFTPYDEQKIAKTNSGTGETVYTYQKINQYLMENGNGLARLTNLSLSFSTSFSSNGITTSFDDDEQDTTKSKKEEPVLGERFKCKYKKYKEADIFGEYGTGYTPISMPWSTNLGLTYNYSKYSQDPKSKTERIFLNASFNWTIAESWRFSASTGYDFLNDEFRLPMMSVSKDLHCWDMQFNWTPFGTNNGFYLRIAIKAPQLKDLKFEKQENPLMR
jgi:hypothetical protein